MTDSTPVRRFNWNEEIREYEDADGDECTYKTVVPASDFDRLQAENVRLTKECERLTKSADWYCRYANDKDKSVTEEMARANIAEKERDSLRAQLVALALAKVEEAQRDAERWRWYRNHRVTHGSVLEEDIDSAMTAKEGG